MILVRSTSPSAVKSKNITDYDVEDVSLRPSTPPPSSFWTCKPEVDDPFARNGREHDKSTDALIDHLCKFIEAAKVCENVTRHIRVETNIRSTYVNTPTLLCTDKQHRSINASVKIHTTMIYCITTSASKRNHRYW